VELGLKGKVALVAASSQGLGRAIADELAAEGARLVISSRGGEKLARATEALTAAGAEVLPVACDLATEEGARKLVEQALAHYGAVDVLVTNTGGPPAGPFDSHSIEQWRASVRNNLESVVLLVQGVLPVMKERRWGRIINVTSISVKQPVDNLILSNSIRAAVTGMARTLANEVARWGITVNNVLPGWTRTERIDELAAAIAKRDRISEAEARAGWESEIPMRRLGEPRELAALVAFLASERAAYITAQSIPVDGGWIRSLY